MRWLCVLFSVGLMLALTGCEDGSDSGPGDACVPNQALECPCAGGTKGVQSCNADGTGFSVCDCGGGSNSGPDDCEATITEDHRGCFENGVYWFDDCDVMGEQLELCSGDASCVDGACQEGCVAYSEKKCNEPGTGLFWYDSCGNQGDLDKLCPENTICAGDECIAACEPHAAKFCLGDQVYWYNSCDEQESIAETCTEAQFCKGCTVDEQPCSISEPSCVKPVVDGTWELVANPDTGDACGLGSSTYPKQDLELVVDGSQSIGPTDESCSTDADCADIAETLPPCLEVACSDANVCHIDRVEDGPQVCGSIVVLGTVVKFTGSLDGKKLELSGSWVQEDTTGLSADIPHEETLEVEFSSQTTFEGIHQDSFVIDMSSLGMGEIPCTQNWFVTGTKE